MACLERLRREGITLSVDCTSSEQVRLELQVEVGRRGGNCLEDLDGLLRDFGACTRDDVRSVDRDTTRLKLLTDTVTREHDNAESTA